MIFKILFIILFLSVPLQAQWGTKWQKNETQCEVCGRALYYNIKIVESPFLRDDMGRFGVGGYQVFIADSAHCYNLSISESTGNICGECHDRYGTIIADMEIMWGKFWDKAKLANAANRKRNDELRKRQTQEELVRQIQELQKRLKEE